MQTEPLVFMRLHMVSLVLFQKFDWYTNEIMWKENRSTKEETVNDTAKGLQKYNISAISKRKVINGNRLILKKRHPDVVKLWRVSSGYHFFWTFSPFVFVS